MIRRVFLGLLAALCLAGLVLAWMLPVERYPGEPSLAVVEGIRVFIVSVLLGICFFGSVLGVALTLRSGAWLRYLFGLLAALAIAHGIDVLPAFQG